ncbi:cell division topological specificity factor MinE [Roseibium sp.]|uniref:cell division topological specificity factor MinE n=1 Tax=Roseibium sp. TaxID=1936156 RepID=UPI003A97F636
MNIMSFFGKRGQSASVAKNRLQILLAHERSGDTVYDAKLISSLREDILAVVAKHINVDPEAVRLEMDRSGDITTLGIDIELPDSDSRKSA